MGSDDPNKPSDGSQPKAADQGWGDSAGVNKDWGAPATPPPARPASSGRSRPRAATMVEADAPDINALMAKARADGWSPDADNGGWGSAEPVYNPTDTAAPAAPAADDWTAPAAEAANAWNTPETPAAAPPASPPPAADAWNSPANTPPAPAADAWNAPAAASPAPAPAANSWDTPSPGPSPQTPPPSSPPPAANMGMTPTAGDGSLPTFSAADIEAGKMMALVSHLSNIVGFPLFVIPFIQKDNGFALFHAKQACGIYAGAFAFAVIAGIITAITCGIGVVLYALMFAFPVAGIFGIIWSNNGEVKRFPWIGEMVEDMLKSVQVENDPKQLNP